MVEDGSPWKKWLATIGTALPISLEAIIAILVLTMVILVLLIERIREPNKEFCHPLRSCSAPLESNQTPPSDF